MNWIAPVIQSLGIAAKDDPEVARVLSLHSAAHMQRRDVEVAESALTRAVAIREKTLGAQSPELADALDDLADRSHRRQGPPATERTDETARAQARRDERYGRRSSIT